VLRLEKQLPEGFVAHPLFRGSKLDTRGVE
jgi:hypothetical protein